MNAMALAASFPARAEVYGRTVLWPHLRVHWANWGSILAAVFTFNHCFTLTFNVSESLPQSVFLVLKGDKSALAIGEYVAFRWVGNEPFAPGTGLLKRVGGVPGDVVTAVDREFYVNGQAVGRAKSHSKMGRPLAIGPVGRIPADHYYMRAPHRDSLDSRYALTGWVSTDQVIGRAVPVF